MSAFIPGSEPVCLNTWVLQIAYFSDRQQLVNTGNIQMSQYCRMNCAIDIVLDDWFKSCVCYVANKVKQYIDS